MALRVLNGLSGPVESLLQQWQLFQGKFAEDVICRGTGLRGTDADAEPRDLLRGEMGEDALEAVVAPGASPLAES